MSQFAHYYYQQGLLLLEQGDNRGAIAALTRAIEIEPNYVNTYSCRGEVHSELENYTEALADFNKAIALDTTNSEYFLERGYTYSKLNEHKKQ